MSKASSSGPGKNGMKMVSHCPECPQYPRDGHGMITIGPKQRSASCKHGHKWQIRIGAVQGRRSVGAG